MDVAESNYKNTADYVKTVSDTLMKILMALAAYLEAEAKYGPQKEFAKWIRKGGECCFYEVQGSCKQELIKELRNKGIPYLELNNNPNEIIIKAPDLEDIREINRSILVSKANYFQEVDGVEMEDVIARFDKIQDKTVFTIKDINEYEKQVVKNKCNDISRGFMVGVTNTEYGEELNQNKYTVTVMADKVYIPDTEKKDFCKAYLEAIFSLYGQNAVKKQMEIESDKKIEGMIDEIKSSDETKFIIGTKDTNFKHYVEMNKEGFLAYTVGTNKKGEKIETLQGSCKKYDINYDSELQRYLDTIKSKAILINSEQLGQYITGAKIFDSLRNEKTYDEEKISELESQACNIINEAVKTKMIDNNMKFNDPQEAFSYYARESVKLMNAAIEGKSIDYPAETVANVKEALDRISINDHAFDAIKAKIDLHVNNNLETHKASKKPEKVVKEARENHEIPNR